MKNYEIDMCRGPLLGKIVLFSLPLMATYILQLLFHAADLVIIGHYAHRNSLAAIGCTMSMNALVLNIFGGLSVGANVVAARIFGENRPERMKGVVNTAMLLAGVGGFCLMIVGLLVAKPLLVLMKTPAEILPLSCTYIWICFLAIPFIVVYNFGCSILRAVGDTRRPLYFLVVAGIVNVVLNMIFVIGFGRNVDGVAIATAVSHGVAALLILRTLLRTNGSYKLVLKGMRMDKQVLKEILRIGIPAGIQSSCFAVSNMTIQSSVNSFGPVTMAGNTAAQGLEGIVYTASFAYHQTAIAFTAQNLGGRKFKRIVSSIAWCFLCTAVSCSLLGWLFYLTGNFSLGLFNSDPEVIQWGMIRLKILFTTYALCGFMDVASGGLRGLGYSILPMIVCLSGACFFRIWWVFEVLPLDRSYANLMLSYPVSWILVTGVNTLILFIVYRKLLSSKCRIATPWLGLKPGMPRGLNVLGNSK